MLLRILDALDINSGANWLRRNVFFLLFNISFVYISKGIVKDCEQIIRKLLSSAIHSFQCEAIFTNVCCRMENAFYSHCKTNAGMYFVFMACLFVRSCYKGQYITQSDATGSTTYKIGRSIQTNIWSIKIHQNKSTNTSKLN